MSLLSWLGLAPADDRTRDPDAIQVLMGPLLALGPERARFLALFAFVLARVAHADAEVSEAELGHIRHELATRGQLPMEQAALVARLAAEQHHLAGGTHGFLATRELRDLASHEEKLAVLDCLFGVASADRHLSGVEEEAIRGISRELLLGNDEYLWMRARYREHRAVHKP